MASVLGVKKVGQSTYSPLADADLRVSPISSNPATHKHLTDIEENDTCYCENCPCCVTLASYLYSQRKTSPGFLSMFGAANRIGS